MFEGRSEELGDVVRAYDNHPEYPYYGPDGQPCTKYTRGVMQRYGVSRRQAERYLAGQDPPLRNILLAQQGAQARTG